jgi:hypothetical protein
VSPRAAVRVGKVSRGSLEIWRVASRGGVELRESGDVRMLEPFGRRPLHCFSSEALGDAAVALVAAGVALRPPHAGHIEGPLGVSGTTMHIETSTTSTNKRDAALPCSSVAASSRPSWTGWI